MFTKTMVAKRGTLDRLLATVMALVMGLAFVVVAPPVMGLAFVVVAPPVAVKAAMDITAGFTDANFLAEVRKALSRPADNPIYDSDVAGIRELAVDRCGITSLAGIEHFTSLTWLVCYGNQLTSLDISANTALTRLDCYSNQLTSLDVSANTLLTYLDCGNNQLPSLDVTLNAALTYLDCYYNRLTSLDIHANTALITLYRLLEILSGYITQTHSLSSPPPHSLLLPAYPYKNPRPAPTRPFPKSCYYCRT